MWPGNRKNDVFLEKRYRSEQCLRKSTTVARKTESLSSLSVPFPQFHDTMFISGNAVLVVVLLLPPVLCTDTLLQLQYVLQTLESEHTQLSSQIVELGSVLDRERERETNIQRYKSACRVVDSEFRSGEFAQYLVNKNSLRELLSELEYGKSDCIAAEARLKKENVLLEEQHVEISEELSHLRLTLDQMLQDA